MQSTKAALPILLAAIGVGGVVSMGAIGAAVLFSRQHEVGDSLVEAFGTRIQTRSPAFAALAVGVLALVFVVRAVVRALNTDMRD